MGARENGKKELLAILDGYRESESSWLELLLNLKERGLTEEPKLAIGDGGLGFWAALREGYPGTREQRCWVHKTGNVLDKMPSAFTPKPRRRSTICTWHRQRNRPLLLTIPLSPFTARSSPRPVSASKALKEKYGKTDISLFHGNGMIGCISWRKR